MSKKKETKKVKKELFGKYWKLATCDIKKVPHLLEVLNSYYGKQLLMFGAYLHNKDYYVKTDEELNPEHKEGSPKKIHYHINLCFSTQIRKSTLDKMVKESFYDWSNGMLCLHRQSNAGSKTCILAMCNMVDYWFHKGEGNNYKYQYSVCFTKETILKNFTFQDYQKYLNTYDKSNSSVNELYLKDDWDKKTKIYNDVYNRKLTLQQLEKEDTAFFHKHINELMKWAKLSVNKIQTPKFQHTFYVCGNDGGVGKSLFSACLMKHLTNDNYHKIVDKRVPFEDYTGQDGILWNDFRSSAVSNMGLDKFLNLIDTTKPDGAVNIKNHYIILKNRFWCFNSIQTISDFIDHTCSIKDKTDEWIRQDEKVNQIVRRIQPINLNYSVYENVATVEITIYKTVKNDYEPVHTFHFVLDNPIDYNKKNQVELYNLYDTFTKWFSQFFNHQEMLFDFDLMLKHLPPSNEYGYSKIKDYDLTNYKS